MTIYRTFVRHCPRCDGRGWIADRAGEQIDCADCGGTGNVESRASGKAIHLGQRRALEKAARGKREDEE